MAETWNAANSFPALPLLTQAAIEALLHHGTEEQQALYAAKLVSGEWTGAMCLTEPQAGSDLGALRTRAGRPRRHWRIFGTKIFITYGEHDLTDNIVHLVLARTPGAPPGTKGISCFIVPKFLVARTARSASATTSACVSIEHKLGINASPTCVMSYGDDGGASATSRRGDRGMRSMFTMMNNARLAVGLEGLGIAERAYQQALAFARERKQGQVARPPRQAHCRASRRTANVADDAGARSPRSVPCPTRPARHGGPQRACARRRGAPPRSRDSVALLTPICKAWSTESPPARSRRSGVQVHGGMGFIEETGAAQHFRDARITPIYEGTNGIQALDLAGRKLTIDDGRLPWAVFGELDAQLPAADADLRPGLGSALDAAKTATRHLQATGADGVQAGATPYLRLMGTTLGAFLLARGARAAGDDPAGAAWPGLARFYVHQLLPPAAALLPAVLRPGADLDGALL